MGDRPGRLRPKRASEIAREAIGLRFADQLPSRILDEAVDARQNAMSPMAGPGSDLERVALDHAAIQDSVPRPVSSVSDSRPTWERASAPPPEALAPTSEDRRRSPRLTKGDGIGEILGRGFPSATTGSVDR